MSNKIAQKENQYQIDRLNKEYAEKRKDLVKQQKREMDQLQQLHEKNITQAQKNNEAAVVQIQQKQSDREYELEKRHQEHVDHVTTKAESEVHEAQQKSQASIHKQKLYQDGELAKQQKQYAAKSQDMEKDFKNKFKQSSHAYTNALDRQRENFTDNYRLNEQAQLEALNVSKATHAKAMIELKKEQLKEADHFNSFKEDPFYRIEDRGSLLHETSDAYILKTYIPAHEQKKIKVSIQNDMAVVSGARSFKDQITDENKKVKSQNYQTFREEFKFEKPVSTRGITEERDGDQVTYTIPKLIYLDKKV